MGLIKDISTKILGFGRGEQTNPPTQNFELFARSLSTLADIQSITADSVLSNPTAFAAIDTLAKTMAQQPLQVVENRVAVPNAYPQGLLDRPNQFTSSYEAMYQIIIDLMTHGQAFVEMRRANNGTVRSWRVIPPTLIKVERDSNGDTALTLSGQQTGVRYGISNIIIDNVTMIRDVTTSTTPGGISRVELIRRLIALDNAIDRFGYNLFNRSLQVGSHVIVIPEILKPEQVDEIYSRMKEQYAGLNATDAGGTPVLEGGVEIQPITPIKPIDADMSNLKRRTSAQITATYGVPAALIELNNGNANYNNVAQRYSGFYRDTINPLSVNIASKLERAFGLAPGVRIRFDATELLKGDYPQQVNSAVSAWRNGIWTLNEARDFTGLPMTDIEQGDQYMFEIADMVMPNNTSGPADGNGDSNNEGN